jgi:GDP-L-fucose synthase
MKLNDRIYVAGHNGLVGSAIVRLLERKGYRYIITASSSELDLRDAYAVRKFFAKEKPQFVFMAAAKVGGIMANSTQGADFIYENLCLQNNVIHECYKSGVEKLLFLGSSCIYPKLAAQPIHESYLMTGLLEPTNSPYAVAKIAGIEMCKAYHNQYGCNFISAMPTNLYGPGDNYDLQNAHVLPALIRKFHEAKMTKKSAVEIWGTGNPRREFLHADDAAEAFYFLMQEYNDANEIVNVGCGEDHSIKEMAEAIQQIVGYKGILEFNTSKPDGTMKKLLDVSKLTQLGWKYAINLEKGLANTYADFTTKYDYYISRKLRNTEIDNV